MNVQQVENIPKVDTWTCNPEDELLKNSKGVVSIPVAEILNVQSDTLDLFLMNTKKCYNSQVMRDHICLYINYFEKFYDVDKNLLVHIARMKFLIDYENTYSEDNFINDITTYIILNADLKNKVNAMVENNYSLDLVYKNIPPNLQYTDTHAKIMLAMSIFMNFCIPLITHYAYIHKIRVIDDWIMRTFDYILHMYPEVDIFAKLYETTYSNVSKSELKNAPIWAQQDIRGKDDVTHSYASVQNIILNIMPKYTFDKSIISLNFTSINKNTSCQILDIEYEFNYIALSSSKRDEDNISDFDKYESNLVKQDESIYVQSKMNSEDTMNTIVSKFGPFDPWEIAFYHNRLKNEKGNVINNFQKQLVFNLFYKYFNDTQSIYNINSDDYIKLMLSAKKILIDNHMILLPYIISGKVNKLIGRKTVNKKERAKLTASGYYDQIYKKYRNEKIINNILSTIATIISSDFSIIDYRNKEIDGKHIDTEPSIVIEEVLMYTLLV